MPDALGLALKYLGRRLRTEAEVRARLRRAGCGAGEVEGAIEELQTLGQLDDARFARLFAQDRRELDGWGQERIARRLGELGIGRELVEEALAGEPDDELQRAVELLGHRFPTGTPDRSADPGDRIRERAFGVLIRKGYESEIAADAVRRWDAARRDCIG